MAVFGLSFCVDFHLTPRGKMPRLLPPLAAHRGQAEAGPGELVAPTRRSAELVTCFIAGMAGGL